MIKKFMFWGRFFLTFEWEGREDFERPIFSSSRWKISHYLLMTADDDSNEQGWKAWVAHFNSVTYSKFSVTKQMVKNKDYRDTNEEKKIA